MNRINEKLAQIVETESRKPNTHSVLLAVSSGDGRVDFRGAGGSGADATPGSPFLLASITKMFTATVVMQLVEEQRIDLDAPIRHYLPQRNLDRIHVYQGTDYSTDITVEHLIGQTSGLADYYEGGMVDDLKDGRDAAFALGEILDTVRTMKPSSAPGSGRAHYSDTNYQLLGAIIESVCGAPLSEVFTQRIFAPLGLTRTYVFDHTQQQPTALPMYNKDRELHIPKALSCMVPDGAIVSTLTDTTTFLKGYFGGRLFPAHRLPQMQQWNPMFFPMEYGYGLWRYHLPKWMSPFTQPSDLIGHAGSTGAFAFYEPNKDLYLVGTFNQIDNPARPFRFLPKVINAL